MPSELTPLEPDVPVVAEAQAVSNEDSSVGEPKAVAEPFEVAGDLPPISPVKKDLTVDSNAAIGRCHS